MCACLLRSLLPSLMPARSVRALAAASESHDVRSCGRAFAGPAIWAEANAFVSTTVHDDCGAAGCTSQSANGTSRTSTEPISFTFMLPHTTGVDQNGQATFLMSCDAPLEPFASVPGYIGAGATPASVLDSERLGCRLEASGARVCNCVRYDDPP